MSKETALSTHHNPKKQMMVITQENVRTLLLKQPREKLSTLSSSTFLKAKELAVYKTPSMEALHREAIAAERDRKANAVQARKVHYASLDAHKTTPLSETDTEQKKKSISVLETANKQLCEQDDDIKKLNGLLMHVKCVAIRDMQLSEKADIAQKAKEEEARLDAMMEQDRVADLERIRRREIARHRDMKKGAEVLRMQIEDRRKEASMIAFERKTKDAIATIEAIQVNRQLEIAAQLEKVEKQREMMALATKYKKEALIWEQAKKEKEIEEERAIVAYTLKKDKEAAEKEALILLKIAEREKDIARLNAAQERLTDKQAQQDKLRAKRAQEEVEREWRRKEKEEMIRQKALENELRASRIYQTKQREQCIAAEARTIRADFLSALEKQKAAHLAVELDKHVKEIKSKEFSKEIIGQISEKQLSKVQARKDYLNEAAKLKALQQEKLERLEIVKKDKIQSLMDMGLPDKYCADIIRKMAVQHM